MKYLKNKIVSVLASVICLLTALGITGFVAEESAVGFIAPVLGGVVLIMVASALIPTIANNTHVASADLTTEGFESTASIVNQWPLAVAIMVFIAIFGAIL